MTQEEELLRIEDLVLRFYTYEGIVEALDGVNLNVLENETLGLVGETGCGKSVTSLATMVVVVPPGKIEKGRILLKNRDKMTNLLKQDDASLRIIRGSYLSMVFQEPRAYLNPVYSVMDQVAEVLMVHKRKELLQTVLESLRKGRKEKGLNDSSFEMKIYERMLKKPNSFITKILRKIPRSQRRLNEEVRKEVIRILREMEIADPDRVAEMYPHELSGGMAQRVVIATALVCRPTLLIADEPTTNLDVTIQAQILNLFKRLKERFKSSVLYITHDLGVVAEICDRVAVMYAGNVVEIANVFDLFKEPLHPYARGLLESIPRPGKEFKSIPGTVPGLINPPKGCRFHDRCVYAMEICRKVKPPLTEIKKKHSVACHLYGGKK